MTLGRTLAQWGAHSINDGNPFSADILADDAEVSTYEASGVEVGRPGFFPVHAYGQPQGKTIELLISIEGVDDIPAAWTQLQGWFDPALGRQYLTATDDDSNAQRLLCFPEQVVIARSPDGVASKNMATVRLHAADPRWEDVNAETDSQDVGEGGGEVMAWTLANDGNTRTPFQVAITSSTAKDPADSWPTRRRVLIANRSDKALDDWAAKKYPVLLCDLSALDDPITPGNDIRVVNNGEFIEHWLEGNLLWTLLAFPPMKSATLGANIDDNDTELSVDNFQGFDHNRWPKDGGFFFLDDEVIQYTARDADQMTIVRGAMGSTAASHTAGATLYWIRYPYLSLLYGYSAAAAPPAYADIKPVIDLAASTNAEHQWPDTFFATERQARAFQRRFSDQGVGALHIRQYGDGTSMVYENNQAVAGKPNHNDAVIEFPVPAVGPLELDEDVELTMLLRGYVADAEGYESKLIDQGFSDGPLTGESFSVPDIVSRLRLVGSVGVVVGNLDDSFPGSWNAQAGATDPETIASYQDTAVRFVLQQDTKMTPGVEISISRAVGATGNLQVLIMEDFNGRPAVEAEPGVISPQIIASASILQADIVESTTPVKTVVSFGAPFHIPAGTYWLVLKRPAGLGSGLFYTGMGTDNAVFLTYLGGSIQDAVSLTFGIMSDETQPQEDAPLDNGDTIEVANLVVPLDSTRAPKIFVSDEEEIDFIDGRLANDDTGDYIDIFFLNPLSNTLTIDTDAHTARDAETGLSVPWAARPSNPERYMDLQAGDNDVSLTEDGVTGRAVVTTWRARRL